MANLSKPARISFRVRRYKAGTKRVVQWLARTAGRVGDLASCVDCLKGQGETKLAPEDLETIRIKVRELKKLAEVIASSDPPVQVPPNLLKELDEVIAGRQECAAWYASQAIDNATELAAQNESHAYFLNTLKDIQSLLRSMTPSDADAPSRPVSSTPEQTKKKTKKKSGKNDKNDSNATGINNLFERLGVDEQSSVDPSHDPPPVYEELPADGLQDTEFELEDSDEDDAFALWCFLSDLNDIRRHLSQVWKSVARGDLSVEVAGQVTEAGFGLMKEANEDFLKAKPRFPDFWSIALFLRLKFGVCRNVVFAFSRDPNAAASDSHSLSKQADFLCSAAALQLRVFREGCQVKLHETIQNPALLGTELDDGFRDRLIGSRPVSQFEPTLFSFLPELTVLAMRHRMSEQHDSKIEKLTPYHTFFTDELLTLLPYNNEPKEPPIWLVVATQICTDIQEIVGTSVAKSTLSRTTETIRDVAQKYAKWRFGHGVTKRNIAQTPGLKHMLDKVKLVEQAIADSGRTSKKCMGARMMLPGLKVLPHFAGELSFSMKTFLHHIGKKMANDFDAVLVMAHLYKASKRYQLVGDWHDMDFVIAQHTGQTPLMTKAKAKDDPHAVPRNFLEDMGMRAVVTATGKLPSLIRDGTHAQRNVAEVDRSSFIAAILDRYYGKAEETKCEDSAFETFLAIATSNESASKHHQALTPIESLSCLQKQLTAIEPRINFDYIGFSRSCIRLLNYMLIAAMTRVSTKDIAQLPETAQFVYYLLTNAADLEAKKKPISFSPFTKACTVLQLTITDSGNSFSKAALAASSGRIPKDRRPQQQSPMVPDAAVSALLHRLPTISIGSSRDVIEIYDPEGSIAHLDMIFNHKELKPYMADLMPHGNSGNISVVTPEIEAGGELLEGYSRPGLNIEDGDIWQSRPGNYITKEQAMQEQEKARKRAGISADRLALPPPVPDVPEAPPVLHSGW